MPDVESAIDAKASLRFQLGAFAEAQILCPAYGGFKPWILWSVRDAPK